MKELCIRCGKETEYDVHTPVNIRRFYIDGSGQLCEECWRELYEKEMKNASDRQYTRKSSK